MSVIEVSKGVSISLDYGSCAFQNSIKQRSREGLACFGDDGAEGLGFGA